MSFFDNSFRANFVEKRKAMETTITHEIEFNRFGFIVVILLIVGCLGGITVGMGAIENSFPLIAAVIPKMIVLIFFLLRRLCVG